MESPNKLIKDIDPCIVVLNLASNYKAILLHFLKSNIAPEEGYTSKEPVFNSEDVLKSISLMSPLMWVDIVCGLIIKANQMNQSNPPPPSKCFIKRILSNTDESTIHNAVQPNVLENQLCSCVYVCDDNIYNPDKCAKLSKFCPYDANLIPLSDTWRKVKAINDKRMIVSGWRYDVLEPIDSQLSVIKEAYDKYVVDVDKIKQKVLNMIIVYLIAVCSQEPEKIFLNDFASLLGEQSTLIETGMESNETQTSKYIACLLKLGSDKPVFRISEELISKILTMLYNNVDSNSVSNSTDVEHDHVRRKSRSRRNSCYVEQSPMFEFCSGEMTFN